MSEAAANRRWWQRLRFRIGMRTLMVLVLLVGGGLGWVVRGARIQREAVAIIEAHGTVYYDWQWDSKKDTVLAPAEARRSTPKWLIDWVGVDYFHHVHGIMLGTPFGPAVPEDVMAQVSRLERLDYLSLDGELTYSDSTMEHFRGLTRLRRLELDMSNGTQKMLLTELPGLKGLEHLAISRATEADLIHLSGLTRIKGLWVAGEKISDDGMADLAELTGLEELSVTCPSITDAGLAHLRGMTRLKTLMLDCPGITDAGLACLSEMAQLETLELYWTKVTNLSGLGPKRSLKRLELAGNPINDHGLKSLEGFPSLISLNIGFTDITDQGLVHLFGLTEIQNLVLSGNKIGDTSLSHLSNMNKLTDLSLAQTSVTDQGIINLKGIKSCEHVVVSGIGITDAGLVAAEKRRPKIRFVRPIQPSY